MTSIRDQLSALLRVPQEAHVRESSGHTDAAVLVPLYLHDGELHAVFTRRHAGLRRHAGEISFPGGRQEPGDRDLLQTALREADEEIGLPADAVDVIGALEPTWTVATGYAIQPFVGLIEPGRSWRANASEVAAVLELSLRRVREGAARRRIARRGVLVRTDVYDVEDQVIWGATARIVSDLLERLDPLLARRDAPART